MTAKQCDFSVVPATPEHARALAPALRMADRRDSETLHPGMAPVDILLESIRVSTEAYAIKLRNRVVGMMGHRTTADGEAVVWMVGASALTESPKRFARGARIWWPRITNKYRRVWNVVGAENTVHVRWLKHLGCTIHPPFPVNGAMFHLFQYVRPT